MSNQPSELMPRWSAISRRPWFTPRTLGCRRKFGAIAPSVAPASTAEPVERRTALAVRWIVATPQPSTNLPDRPDTPARRTPKDIKNGPDSRRRSEGRRLRLRPPLWKVGRPGVSSSRRLGRFGRSRQAISTDWKLKRPTTKDERTATAEPATAARRRTRRAARTGLLLSTRSDRDTIAMLVREEVQHPENDCRGRSCLSQSIATLCERCRRLSSSLRRPGIACLNRPDPPQP